MNEELWNRVEELFDRCSTASEEERQLLLEEAERENPEVAAEVRSLLAFEGDGTQIDHVLDGPRERLFANSTQLEAGQAFASYTLVRALGAGGMGTVWLAERDLEGIAQRVALKILTAPHAATAGRFLERFDDERRILSGLDHPNIARLIDAGTTDSGTAYYAMEFVDGQRLTDHCWSRGAGLRQRIGLFLDVCRAVEHAQRRFVIHRDIKPDNILVDGDGRARLLDFGIAKLQDAARADADRAGLTRPEERLLTPNYASPEQVLGEPVSTASDVYSLGVVLYELLTGTPPRRLDELAPAKMAQAFASDAPSASTAVTDTQRTAEGQPTSVPLSWSKQLAGDLDTILAKALQADPERRYADATALIDDLERYLGRRPIRARPDSHWYRFRRFCQRNAAAVTAGSVGAALVLAAGVGLVAQARSLRQERDRAVEAEASARTVIDFLTDSFRVVDPSESRGQTVTARELLDRGAERIDQQLADQPAARAELTGVLAEVYRGLGLMERSGDLHARAVDLSLSTFGQEDLRTAEALSQQGNALRATSRFKEAQVPLERALALFESQLPADDPRYLQALSNYGLLLSEQGRVEEAEVIQSRTLDLRRSSLGADHADTLTAQTNLAITLRRLGRHEECEQLHREVVEARQRTLGPDHPATANALHNHGSALASLSRTREAAETFERALESRVAALGPDHRLVGTTHNALASAYHDLLEFDRAEGHYRRSLEITQLASSEPTRGYAYTLGNLAALHLDRGAFDEAVRDARLSLEARRQIFDPVSRDVLNGTRQLGAALMAAGRFEEAIETLDRALELRDQPGMSASPFPRPLLLRGEAERRAGDLERAEISLNEALEAALSLGRSGRFVQRTARAELAMLHAARGNLSACRGELEIVEDLSSGDRGRLWQSRAARDGLARGDCSAAAGELTAARAAYQRVVDDLEPLVGPQNPWVRRARQRLERLQD